MTDKEKKTEKKAEEPIDEQPETTAADTSFNQPSDLKDKESSEQQPQGSTEKPEPSEESSVDPPATEPKSEETAELPPEEQPKSDESPTEESVQEEPQVEEQEIPVEEPQEMESSEEPVQQKAAPKEKDKPAKKPAKKGEEDEDFQYIVRIANTDIDGSKTVVMGIAQIKGIGRHMANLIADATGIDKKLKMGKLSDKQIEKIREMLERVDQIAPGWMLNHRKDIDTGKDIHLISADVDLRLRDDINLLKMIRSYRGVRHETGLSVRGQRTRANNRRGLALGVSKKRP